MRISAGPYFLSSIALIAMTASVSRAETPRPQADKPGTSDSPLLKRFEGSVIIAADHRDFAEFVFPLSKLEPLPGKTRDAHGRNLLAPKRSKSVEGKYTRLLYLLPANRSSLEVSRNYADAIKAAGGKILFECKAADCGGEPRANVFGTSGGDIGLSMFLYPEDRVKEPYASPASCAMNAGVSEQRYLVAELPDGAGHVSVLTYETPAAAGGNCKAFTAATFAAVDLVENKSREHKMVTIASAEMAQAISNNGKIALYGIYFDSNKADVKPESNATLEQIGKLLSENPKLKVLVVGHTDNVGTLTSNTDLSQRRAANVVTALSTHYGVKKERLTPVGVSFAAPVASNRTEEGRAKNRRVELVEN